MASADTPGTGARAPSEGGEVSSRFPSSAPTERGTAGTLLVENGLFLTQDAARPIVRGALVARDGVIEALGPEARAGDADEVVDAAGGLVTPGLVNAHTHAAMTLFRGFAEDLPLERWLAERVWPAEARLDARAVRAGSGLAALEMLAAGVTAFNDMYFFADETAAVAEAAGLRAVVGAVFLDFPTPEMPPERMEAHAREFVLRWSGKARVRPSLAPHGAYTCGPGTLARIASLRAELAAGGAAPMVHTHCAETLTEVQTVLGGAHAARPLAAFDRAGLLGPGTVLAHCGWCTKDEVRRIAAAGAAVAHCPVSNMKLATGGWLPLPELLEAGAAVGVGTDGAASNNTLDVLESAKLAALAQKQHRWDAAVVPAATALALATRGGARALGLESGVLSPGRPADLAVWSLERPGLRPLHDPVAQLVHAARGTDVRATVVDGRVLYEDGEFLSLDAPRILADASREAERAAGRG